MDVLKYRKILFSISRPPLPDGTFGRVFFCQRRVAADARLLLSAIAADVWLSSFCKKILALRSVLLADPTATFRKEQR